MVRPLLCMIGLHKWREVECYTRLDLINMRTQVEHCSRCDHYKIIRQRDDGAFSYELTRPQYEASLDHQRSA